MVVGTGMMAQAFSAFGAESGVVVFASGVSDSTETRQGAFDRERDLLERTLAKHPDSLVLYFGTCSVYDPDRNGTPYVRHKLAMEDILTSAPNPWLILRLPLAIGRGHRGNTLAKFLHQRILRDEPFEVWSGATRYPLDVEDAFRIATRLVADRSLWRRRVNIVLRAFRILDFVDTLEDIVGRPARYTLLRRGHAYEVRCPEVMQLAQELQLDLSERYLERVLRRYFDPAS